MIALHVCSEPGCPTLTERPSGKCDGHDGRSARNHRGIPRQARGYDRSYELARLELLGEPCALSLPGCTGSSTTAQHTDDDRLVGACAHCNFADGARRSRLS